MTEGTVETTETVIAVENLVRHMGLVEAVNDVSFTVERGSVFGLIGPNGSGKTTTLRCMLGLLTPDRGRCTVLGADSTRLPAELRRRIGYLSEEPFPYSDVDVPGLLSFLSALYTRWDWDRCDALIRRLDVRTDVPLDSMSLGQRRRAELLLAIAPGPELLVLDDPWLGVDTRARRQFLLATLETAREEGTTILFTSHVLSDVERVADRVAILVGGHIRALDGVDDFKARVRRLVIDLRPGVDPASVVVPGELERTVQESTVEIVTSAYSPGLERSLSDRAGAVRSEAMNLEEIYLALCPADGEDPDE